MTLKKRFQYPTLILLTLALSTINSMPAQAGFLGMGGPKNIPVTQVEGDIAAGKGMSYYKWDRDYKHVLGKTDSFFVAGFQVKYIYAGAASGSTTGSSSSRASGGGYIEHAWKAGEKVSMEVEMKGVSDADLQKFTDKVYADFVQQLNSSGLKLVDVAKVKAAMGKAAFKTAPNPYLSEDTIHSGGEVKIKTFSPTGMSLFFFNGSGNMGAFGLDNNKATGSVSHELNAIALLPTITLSFMKMESSGNHVYIPVDAEVKVEEAAYISPLWFDTSMVWIYQDNPVAADAGKLFIKDNLTMPGSIGEFVDVTSQETKDKDASLNALKTGLSVMTALMGSPTSQTMTSHQNVDLQTTPEKFESVVKPGALVMNKLYVDALKNTK